MLEAVAHGKAHGLFDARRSEFFAGVRRPQEDMVTSAVFGSATLLPMPDRRAAFDLILGADCLATAGFLAGTDVTVEFWPSFAGAGRRRRVEPDVLLTCAGRTLIVEVKWHAPLPDHQLADEIAAVRADKRDVHALLMLGEAGDAGGPVDDDMPVFRRTWRAVSADLAVRGGGDGPLDRWRRMVHAFLQRTDLGHVFAGFDAAAMRDPGRVAFRFQRPGDPPWFTRFVHDVGRVAYTYGREP